MNIRVKLIEYGKKNISLDDLASILKISIFNTEALYMNITKLIEEQLVEPVNSSDTNGNRNYPLHKKYRIIIDNSEDYYEVEKQLKCLHPSILQSGYLASHLAEYKKNKDLIDRLSAYLFSSCSNDYISRKERSFDIFGREKVLDDKSIQILLRNLRISDDDLRFYDTPEYCFHDYIPVRKEQMTLLICENKDIWFNIRRCMFEDQFTHFWGTAIDGVVYGNGNRVSQHQGALTEYVRFMGNPQVRFLYWGDIDREGFDIYRRTKEANAALDISLFIPGYKKMIERAMTVQIEDSPSSRLENKNFDDLIDAFSVDEQEFLREVFEKNKLVPQEIISYVHLSEG